MIKIKGREGTNKISKEKSSQTFTAVQYGIIGQILSIKKYF